MISKAVETPYDKMVSVAVHPRLSQLERSFLKWAAPGPDQRVLDVGLGNGALMDYLKRISEQEPCGVADDLKLVRRARAMVRSADIVYAADGDIPWSDEAFQVVFVRPGKGGQEALNRRMEEAIRVLKPQGQLVLAVRDEPRLLYAGMRLLGGEADEDGEGVSTQEMMKQLKQAGMSWIVRHRAGPFLNLILCYKGIKASRT